MSPQDPVPQDPSTQDYSQHGMAVAQGLELINSGQLELGEDGSLPDSLTSLLDAFQEPDLRGMAENKFRQRLAARTLFPVFDELMPSVLDGGSWLEKLAGPTFGAEMQDLVYDLAAPYIGMPMDLMAGVPLKQAGTRGSYGPAGTDAEGRTFRDVQIEDNFTASLLKLVGEQPDLKPGVRGALAALSPEEARGVAWMAVQDGLYREAEGLSTGGKFGRAFLNGATHLGSFLFIKAPIINKAGAAVPQAWAGMKSAAVMVAANRSGRAAGMVKAMPKFFSRNSQAGALVAKVGFSSVYFGALESDIPFTAAEEAFISMSEDPEGTRNSMLWGRGVETAAAWPFYELTGHIAGRARAAMLGRNLNLRMSYPTAQVGGKAVRAQGPPVPSLGAGKASIPAKIGAGLTSAAIETLGFETLPTMASALVRNEQRTEAAKLISQAYGGDLTPQSVWDYAIQVAGGTATPLAAIGIVRALRAAPSLDARTREMLGTISKDALSQVPPALRDLAVLREEAMDGVAFAAINATLSRSVADYVNEGRGLKAKGDKGWEAKLRGQGGEGEIERADAEGAQGSPAAELAIDILNGKRSGERWAYTNPGSAFRGMLAGKMAKAIRQQAVMNLYSEGGWVWTPPTTATGEPAGLGMTVDEPAPPGTKALPPKGPTPQPAGRSMKPLPGPREAKQRAAALAEQIKMGQMPAMTDGDRQRLMANESFLAHYQTIDAGHDPAVMDDVRRTIAPMEGPPAKGQKGALEGWGRVLNLPELDHLAADVLGMLRVELMDAAEEGDQVSPVVLGRHIWGLVQHELDHRHDTGGLPDIDFAVIQAQTLRRLVNGMQADPELRAAVAPFFGAHTRRVADLFIQEEKSPDMREIPGMFSRRASSQEVEDAYEAAAEAIEQGLQEAQQLLLEQQRQPVERQWGAIPLGGAPAKPAQGGAPQAPQGQEAEAEPEQPEKPEAPAKPAASPLPGPLVRDVGGSSMEELADGDVILFPSINGETSVRRGVISLAAVKTHPKLQPRKEDPGPLNTDPERVASMAETWEPEALDEVGFFHLEAPPDNGWKEGWAGEGFYLYAGHHRFVAAMVRDGLGDYREQVEALIGRPLEIPERAEPVGMLPAKFLMDATPEQALARSGESNLNRAEMGVFENAAWAAQQLERFPGASGADLDKRIGKRGGWTHSMAKVHALVEKFPSVREAEKEGAFGRNTEGNLRALAKAVETYPNHIHAGNLKRLIEQIRRNGYGPTDVTAAANYVVTMMDAFKPGEGMEQGALLPEVVDWQRRSFETAERMVMLDKKAKAAERRLKTTQAELEEIAKTGDEKVIAAKKLLVSEAQRELSSIGMKRLLLQRINEAAKAKIAGAEKWAGQDLERLNEDEVGALIIAISEALKEKAPALADGNTRILDKQEKEDESEGSVLVPPGAPSGKDAGGSGGPRAPARPGAQGPGGEGPDFSELGGSVQVGTRVQLNDSTVTGRVVKLIRVESAEGKEIPGALVELEGQKDLYGNPAREAFPLAGLRSLDTLGAPEIPVPAPEPGRSGPHAAKDLRPGDRWMTTDRGILTVEKVVKNPAFPAVVKVFHSGGVDQFKVDRLFYLQGPAVEAPAAPPARDPVESMGSGIEVFNKFFRSRKKAYMAEGFKEGKFNNALERLAERTQQLVESGTPAQVEAGRKVVQGFVDRLRKPQPEWAERVRPLAQQLRDAEKAHKDAREEPGWAGVSEADGEAAIADVGKLFTKPAVGIAADIAKAISETGTASHNGRTVQIVHDPAKGFGVRRTDANGRVFEPRHWRQDKGDAEADASEYLGGEDGTFHAGMSAGPEGYNILRQLRTVGLYLIQKGFTSFKDWVREMFKMIGGEGKDPRARQEANRMLPHLHAMWNEIRESDPAFKKLMKPAPPFANPKRSLSDDPYQAEIDIAADIERRKREGEDPIATDTLTSRMSWDEQMDWAIRNDIERAARGMGVKSQEAVLPDEFEGIWPVPDMEIQHKVWKLLRPHQLGAVKMARAAFENGASMFLLADGTGTGKTWAGLGTALEHQLHAGGKIILVTQGNVAVESWLADEFGPEKMDVPREAILSPTDIANLTPKELTQRLAAANMVIGLWHHFDPNKDSTNQYRALQEMAKSGDVSAVFADEIHTIRNWVKGTERAVRGVDWVDQLVDNNAKVIAASATPGNELYDLRYFAKGFLGKSAGNDEFRSWVLGAGYSGRQGGKAIARNPKREKVILASQLAFRQDLGRRGLMVNREMSYEGVAVIPGKVHLTPDDLARFEALEEKYAILSEAFSIAGTSGLKGILSPLIINESRRFAEEFKISAAIDWAIDALRRGRRPVIMTRYLNESAQNAVDEMVEDPKTGKMTVKYGMLNKPREKLDGMSVRDIINQKMPGYGDALNERLEEINTRLGKAVPSIASMIEEFRRRARAELGYDINVAEFHGALPDSLKVEHVQNWKNPETTLDAMVGSDLSMGTGISLHDLIGRGVTQIMVGLSWKAGEMVQTIGRGNRDGQLSWPEHVWLQATELWPEERQLKKIFAHMSSLRAQVRGLRSEKDDIKTVVDAGGLTLQGLRDESEVEIDEASRILEEAKKRVERRRREREGLDVEPIKDESDGITIEPETLEERREQEAPALDFLRDAMLRAKAVRKELGESGPDLTGYKDLGFNSFEAWKSEVERAAQDLTQEFDADAIEAKTVPMEDVYTLAMRGSAGRRLGDLMLSPDIKGNEEEAKAHLAAVLGSVGLGETGAIEGGDKKDTGLGSRFRKDGGRESGKVIMPLPSPKMLTKLWHLDPLHNLLVSLFKPMSSEDQMPTMPPKLYFGKAEKWFGTPTGKLGRWIVEPWTTELARAALFLRNSNERYKDAWKVAEAGPGGKRDFLKRGLPILARALSGEHFSDPTDPVGSRLGRVEEYESGSRDTAELRDQAEAAGVEWQEHLLSQPTYRSLVDPVQAGPEGEFRHLYELFSEARSTLDFVRDEIVHTDPHYQYLVERANHFTAKAEFHFRRARDLEVMGVGVGEPQAAEKTKAALMKELALAAKAKQQAEEAKQKAVEFFEGWGITEYFTHLFTRPDGRTRWLPGWMKGQIGKDIYNKFLNGRADWALDWIEDFDKVYWTYLNSMVRVVHMRRAMQENKRVIEGERQPVYWAGDGGFRPSKKSASQDELYAADDVYGPGINPSTVFGALAGAAAGGPVGAAIGAGVTGVGMRAAGKERAPWMQYRAGQRINDLPRHLQDQAKESGNVIKRGISAVWWNGERWSVKKKSGARNYERTWTFTSAGDSGKTKELADAEIREEFFMGDVGGLANVWEGTDAQSYYETFTRHLMHSDAYEGFELMMDRIGSALYQSKLGFWNLPSAGTNWLGGHLMNLYKLGPVATMDGIIAARSGRYKELLHDASILTPAEQFLMAGGTGGMGARLGGTLGQTANALQKAKAGFSPVSMFFFMLAEKDTRQVAFLAGHRAAGRAGMSEQERNKKGFEAVGVTQFHYDGTDSPMVLWNPIGRFWFHLAGWGMRAMNVIDMDMTRTQRAFADVLHGHDPRSADKEAYRRLLRAPVMAWMLTSAVGWSTAWIMSQLFGDDDSDGMDISHTWGTRLADMPAPIRNPWFAYADAVEKRTGVEVHDWTMPGLFFPQGLSAPVQWLSASAGYIQDGVVARDRRAGRRFAAETFRIAFPTQVKRFLEWSDMQSPGENEVADIVKQLRGIPGFNTMVPPPDLDPFDKGEHLGKNGVTAKIAADGRVLWYDSGPLSAARLMMPGIPRKQVESGVQRHYFQFLDNNHRAARAWLKESVQDWAELIELDRPQEEIDAAEATFMEFAKATGVTADKDFIEGALRDSPYRRHDVMGRTILQASREMGFEMLVSAAEQENMEPEAWSLLLRDMAKSDRGLARWINQSPEHKQRLELALSKMGYKNPETTDPGRAQKNE